MQPDSRQRFGPGFVLGLVLIAAGVSSLLERAHILENPDGQWWPFVFVGIGIAKLASAQKHRGAGLALLGVGVWGLLVSFTSLTFGDTWPLLLLLWGGMMIVTSQRTSAMRCGERGSHVS